MAPQTLPRLLRRAHQQDPYTYRLVPTRWNLHMLAWLFAFVLMSLLTASPAFIYGISNWERTVFGVLALWPLLPASRLLKRLHSAGTFLELSPKGLTVSVCYKAHRLPWGLLGAFTYQGHGISAPLVDGSGQASRWVRGSVVLPEVFGFGQIPAKQLARALNLWHATHRIDQTIV